MNVPEEDEDVPSALPSNQPTATDGRSTVVKRQGPFSYQTVKLTKGRHGSPEEGACVMELASMLAGEPFSDHPKSVCPVIASFLRAYNDAIDDPRRQDLYAYVSKVVGSRATHPVQRARARRVAAFAAEQQRRRLLRLPKRLAGRAPALLDVHTLEAAGVDAVRAIRRHTDQTHAEALALIEELLAIDPETPTAAHGQRQPDSHATAPTSSPREATAPTRSACERATLRLLRARHTST